jgi:hypothetical protein
MMATTHRKDSRGVVRVIDRAGYLAHVLRRTGRDASRDISQCLNCGRMWD